MQRIAALPPFPKKRFFPRRSGSCGFLGELRYALDKLIGKALLDASASASCRRISSACDAIGA